MTILEPTPMEVISRLRAHIREWGFQSVSRDILWYDGLRKVLPQAAAVSGVWNVVVIRSGAGYWSRENGLDTRTLCTSAGDVRTLEYTGSHADTQIVLEENGQAVSLRKNGREISVELHCMDTSLSFTVMEPQSPNFKRSKTGPVNTPASRIRIAVEFVPYPQYWQQ